MTTTTIAKIFIAVCTVMVSACQFTQDTREHSPGGAQLGARPFFLVDDMDDGPLKSRLLACGNQQFTKSEFSIGHRGAPLQFPEHTLESYRAAARMGAGILECDVTFTKDRQLVCRHSQCDLHTTTNILATDLAAQCSEPFSAAEFDDQGKLIKPAAAKCCTSDITLVQFKSLKGKMDAADVMALDVEAYMGGTPNWRTDLYASTGTLLSHRESIALFQSLQVKMTPELKTPSVDMPFAGDYSQKAYAQQMIDEYKEAGVPASEVFVQSFDPEDVMYWIKAEPEYGRQAVMLDGRDTLENFDHNNPETWDPSMQSLVDAGVKIIGPPLWMLLAEENGTIVPSVYAKAAKDAGLEIIAWTLERSGSLTEGGGWYFQTLSDVVNNDGDVMEVLDVLARDVGVIGVFSDWPATVTYYANCMNR